MRGAPMNKVNINVESGAEPFGVLISHNGKVLVDMPADEFVGWLAVVRDHLETCRQKPLEMP